MAQAKRRVASKGPEETPLIEWIAAAVGLVLVLATTGLIVSEMLQSDDSPPDIVVQMLQVSPGKGGYLMTISVENRGGSPAAGVVVEGELAMPAGPPETAEATFDFVPDHSMRQGGLVFQTDPRGARLTLRAKGYTEP